MLTELDKDAVFALLVRQIKAQNQRDESRAAMAKAQAELDAASETMAKLRSGFAIFGFEGDQIWENIREAIGNERVSRAFEVAKEATSGPTSKKSDEACQSHPVSPEDNDHEYEPLDGEDESPPSKIREIVLERLRAAGAQGTKVGEIKKYIETQGIEMHDKTVGMTLYRLSKESLARRDGRVWFAVEKNDNGLQE